MLARRLVPGPGRTGSPNNALERIHTHLEGDRMCVSVYRACRSTYEVVKERRLPASELLQEAAHTKVRRRKLQAASPVC